MYGDDEVMDLDNSPNTTPRNYDSHKANLSRNYYYIQYILM